MSMIISNYICLVNSFVDNNPNITLIIALITDLSSLNVWTNPELNRFTILVVVMMLICDWESLWLTVLIDAQYWSLWDFPLGDLVQTFLHSHFGDLILNYFCCQSECSGSSWLILFFIFSSFFSLAYSHPSDSAPSHLLSSDKCDVTPSEDH